MGEAKYKVDKVPNTTPIVIINEKLNKVPCPKKIIGISTIRVVPEVRSVLDRVELTDFEMTSKSFISGFNNFSSLIRSKTMIVSFNE
jgi:hypothetical protein